MQFNSPQDLDSNTIAVTQESNGEETSGFIAVSDGESAAVTRYGPSMASSPYDALTDYGAHSIIWQWEGSLEDLIQMAQDKTPLHEGDEVAPALNDLYEQVLNYVAMDDEDDTEQEDEEESDQVEHDEDSGDDGSK